MKSSWGSDEMSGSVCELQGLQVGERLAPRFIADNILIFMFIPGL